MIHDPAIFYDEVSGNYYTYSTGAICQKSKDLVHWQEIGKVVERPPQESVEWTGSEDIWAPDIVKVGKEYRLYCSNSSWGVRQSCIFLAVADCPEGPFEPKGCVLKTTEKFPQSVTNAIDANIIEDAKTGEQYMLYGSFWGGCHVLKLNKTTGFAEEEGIGGSVVFLTATPQTIYERVKNSTDRPLLNGHMNVAYISELMEVRRPKYEAAADILVATDGKTKEEIAEEIIGRLEE